MPHENNPASSTGLAAVTGRMGERLVTALCDLTVVVDASGTIVAANAGMGTAADAEAWKSLLGKRFVDTVTPESQGKVAQLIREAREQGRSRTREINVLVAPIGEVPFRFTMAPMDEDRLLGFGVDIRPLAALQQRLVTAQQALEVEHERIRQAEVQYRVLFHVCSEGVVIARGSPLVISEMNPAMLDLLGVAHDAPVGGGLRELVAPGSEDALLALLAAAETGRSTESSLRLRAKDEPEVKAAATVFRQGGETVALVRFWRPGAPGTEGNATNDRMLDVIAAMPDAFVVTDGELRVLTANAAFCTLVERASELQVVGQSLRLWLGSRGVDLDIMMASLRERGLVRSFATIARSEFGAEQEVFVTAVAVHQGDESVYGFTLRMATPLSRGQVRVGPASSRTEVKELVGRMSLKDIVQESADLVERLCIEAALDISGNNRAAAAKLLRLSRQSLYTKLRGLGLDDHAVAAVDDSGADE